MDIQLFKDILQMESTSGMEKELAEMLALRLKTPHNRVELSDVGDGTRNLLLTWGNPRVLLCTHLDTVPPYIPPVFDGETFRGRGTCDAKGQIWALYQACLSLEVEGCTDFGLLLLSGEETGSWGAKHFAQNHSGAEYLLVAEPTDNRMVAAAKGTKAFQIDISGVSCHSSYPERGISAIDNFVDFVNFLRSVRFPDDTLLGATTWNIGKLSSDNPQNILSDSLSFRLYFRTTFASDEAVTSLMSTLCNGNEPWRQHIEVKALGGDTPTRFFTVDDIPATTVAFGSDAPHLTNFEHKMLCGPGSITVAHTPDEFVTRDALETATRQYVAIYHSIFNNNK